MNTKKQPAKKTKTIAAKKVVKAKTKVEKPKLKIKSKAAVSRKPVAKIVVKPKKKIVKKSASIALYKKVASVQRHSTKRESAFKEIAYKLLALIVGLLVSSFVYSFVEFVILKKALENTASLNVYTYLGINSYVPFPLAAVILLVGFFFGIKLGNWGWQYVYIERRHRMFKKA